MRKLAIAPLVAILGACTTPGSGVTGTGIGSDTWACTTYDMNQEYFKGYGDSRESAFESAMQQCKFNAPDPTTCIGSADHCRAPEGSP